MTHAAEKLSQSSGARTRAAVQNPWLDDARAQVFETALGWMAILGEQGRLVRVVFDQPSAADVWKALAPSHALPRAWNSRLQRRLEQFAEGRRVDFGDVELKLDDCTPFVTRVIAACRAVGYGRTSDYASLAAAAGSPRAARAVGNVMRANRWPIVVPCHRILASGGRLGGYSAPSGLALKKRLLALEATGTARGT